MMKILIIQERGRHEKNREFREALNFERAFKRLGIDCITWGLNYQSHQISFKEIVKDIDIILLLENYEIENWLPDLSSINKLKIFWSIDSHVALSSHLKTCEKNKIDIVLNSTYSYLNHFKKPGRKVYWFPNCYPMDLIYPMDGIEKWGVGFCGSIQNRGSFIQRLQREVNLRHDNFVIGNDMVKAINSYKISWNRNISNDINYRTFETLGCRTFLITNETDKLGDLFKVGQHLITYKSIEDCIDKINYYLNHDSELTEIQNNGYKHVLENHTFDKRATQFLNIVNE